MCMYRYMDACYFLFMYIRVPELYCWYYSLISLVRLLLFGLCLSIFFSFTLVAAALVWLGQNMAAIRPVHYGVLWIGCWVDVWDWLNLIGYWINDNQFYECRSTPLWRFTAAGIRCNVDVETGLIETGRWWLVLWMLGKAVMGFDCRHNDRVYWKVENDSEIDFILLEGLVDGESNEFLLNLSPSFIIGKVITFHCEASRSIQINKNGQVDQNTNLIERWTDNNSLSGQFNWSSSFYESQTGWI